MMLLDDLYVNRIVLDDDGAVAAAAAVVSALSGSVRGRAVDCGIEVVAPKGT